MNLWENILWNNSGLGIQCRFRNAIYIVLANLVSYSRDYKVQQKRLQSARARWVTKRDNSPLQSHRYFMTKCDIWIKKCNRDYKKRK